MDVENMYLLVMYKEEIVWALYIESMNIKT